MKQASTHKNGKMRKQLGYNLFLDERIITYNAVKVQKLIVYVVYNLMLKNTCILFCFVSQKVH